MPKIQLSLIALNSFNLISELLNLLNLILLLVSIRWSCHWFKKLKTRKIQNFKKYKIFFSKLKEKKRTEGNLFSYQEKFIQPLINPNQIHSTKTQTIAEIHSTKIQTMAEIHSIQNPINLNQNWDMHNFWGRKYKYLEKIRYNYFYGNKIKFWLLLMNHRV